MTSVFQTGERVADAVLHEGYVLYPYRASAVKNKFRWQFGVLAPRRPDEDGEPWNMQTECLIDTDGYADPPRLWIRVRALHPRAQEETASSWLEGAPCSWDLPPIDLAAPSIEHRHAIPVEEVAVGISVVAETEGRFVRVRVVLANREAWRPEFETSRDAMLRRSLVAAHMLFAVESGAFVSMLEPPEVASALVAGCQNRQAWPVLVGDRSRRNLMLSSPIVLYDFPAVAEESRTELCDAAEIDEILSLRILTLTDEEKREARATDPRARAILDQVESLTPEGFGALHGTMRSADFFNPPGTPAPQDAHVMLGPVRIAKGSHVRLRPTRRADAMDMFLRGQAATVAGVYRDVDERTYVAVTVDADPAASLHESFGRFFYFDPDEIEALEEERA